MQVESTEWHAELTIFWRHGAPYHSMSLQLSAITPLGLRAKGVETMAKPTDLRSTHERLKVEFQATVRAIAPHLTEFDWYRARAAQRGELGRHNDDKTFDVELSESAAIESAHDAYIRALHAFYEARDGASGFLGGR